MADGVNWTGTDDEDRYVGTSNDDTLDGDRGDDEILAGAGADTIEGGRGNDRQRIDAGAGAGAERNVAVDVLGGGFDACAELGGGVFILHKHSRALSLLHVSREKKKE